jgi:hypothetical protein
MRRSEEGQVEAIPADLDPHEVLAQYLSENTTSQIAKSYGIRRKSLVAWLRKTLPSEWREVQLNRAHDRKDVGNEGLDGARDSLSLARAREQIRSAHLDLAALDPDYRPKTSIDVTGAPLTDADAGLLTDARELLTLIRARKALESVAAGQHSAVQQDVEDAQLIAIPIQNSAK